MAKKAYVGVSNVAQEIKKIYVGVNGVARNVVKGYVGVNGVAQQFFPSQVVPDTWESISTLPIDFYQGTAVVYNDKIHILGGQDNPTAHYAWDGSSWSEIAELPWNFTFGSAVVYNNEIHAFGPTPGFPYIGYHYKFNGTQWTQDTNVPYSFNGNNRAVIYDGDAYTMCTNYGRDSQFSYCAKWNGSWTKFGNGDNSVYSNACVYNNLIYMMGRSGDNSKYMSYDGTNFSALTSIDPNTQFNFKNGAVVEYKGKMHIIGGNGSGYPNSGEAGKNYNNHYTWDGVNSLVHVADLPYKFYGCPAVVYRGRIHIFGGYSSDDKKKHYAYGSN